jgi:hypothetical protein
MTLYQGLSLTYIGGVMDTRVPADVYESWRKTWPKIVARAWADPAFLQRLNEQPLEVAKEYNLPILEGARYKVVSGNEPPTLTLSIPPKPDHLKTESMEDLALSAEEEHCGDSSCL